MCMCICDIHTYLHIYLNTHVCIEESQDEGPTILLPALSCSLSLSSPYPHQPTYTTEDAGSKGTLAHGSMSSNDWVQVAQ